MSRCQPSQLIDIQSSEYGYLQIADRARGVGRHALPDVVSRSRVYLVELDSFTTLKPASSITDVNGKVHGLQNTLATSSDLGHGVETSFAQRSLLQRHIQSVRLDVTERSRCDGPSVLGSKALSWLENESLDGTGTRDAEMRDSPSRP